MSESVIKDVSETALWVATYRALESERPDALFHDPLAGRLAGEKGRAIANEMTGSRYTAWSVVIRTCVIDGYIDELTSKGGVDLVLNLGAGLDTRPYRLKLPPALKWVEVDFPHMIEHKEALLGGEKPLCQLERVKLDLSNREARTRFFAGISSQGKNILVLTEGVMPYLTVEQGAELAEDLRKYDQFKYWIAEYFAPEIRRFITAPKRARQMKNAPFQFFPDDWFGFFEMHGWRARETRYLPIESKKYKREMPFPWWVRIVRALLPAKKRDELAKKTMGYVLFEPKPPH
jgi:methyltransferase (TIGR00027 family)